MIGRRTRSGAGHGRTAATPRPGICAWAAGVLFVAACDVDRAPAPRAEEPDSAEIRAFRGDLEDARRGRALFLANNCYGCHGGLAGGGMGPSLRDDVWKHGGTDDAIRRSIEGGHPGVGMPPMGEFLSAAEVGQLVTYIQSLRTDGEPTFFFRAAADDEPPQPGARPGEEPRESSPDT